MRFSEYMNEWLYGTEGYYKTFRDIGKEGDFYTSVSTSAFFGASIANYLYKSIQEGDIPRDSWLIEIGAHKGYLLADMIEWLYSCDSTLIDTIKFAIVERQEPVKEIQKSYFNERFGDDINLHHFSSLDEVNVSSALFVSNEIFDAFACELYKDGKMAEVVDDRVKWVSADKELIDFAKHHKLQKGEIAIGYEDFAKRVSNTAQNLEFISFDYGERYVRNDFSIRIYQNHKTYPLFDDEVNLKGLFAKSDITYDVNFAHLIDAFENEGLDLKHYETQARALVRYGLIDILEQYSKVANYTDYIKQADRVKTLIAPTLMGDRFKVVEFSKRA